MEISRMSEEQFDAWYSGIDAKFPTIDMFQAGKAKEKKKE